MIVTDALVLLGCVLHYLHTVTSHHPSVAMSDFSSDFQNFQWQLYLSFAFKSHPNAIIMVWRNRCHKPLVWQTRYTNKKLSTGDFCVFDSISDNI